MSSFYFYDLETTGVRPRYDRIIQFAGVRTDIDLDILADQHNYLIKLTPDILPDPYAVLISGITPQQTLKNGAIEADFTTKFNEIASSHSTIFVGYNNVRFDDEFIRYTNFRNFYEPYSWHWQNGNSRWDMLDVARMTRALRPQGINWPFSPEGKPTNRLELLSKLNNISHDSAHDALADVKATLEIARLINKNQPKLFKYLLNLRHKSEVLKVISKSEPYIYTSGHYPSDILHTTVVATLDFNKSSQTALVYDLRQDPKIFVNLSVEQLISSWQNFEDPNSARLPIKSLKINRVPALAPTSVLDQSSIERLSLNMDKIRQHFISFQNNKDEFAAKMNQVVKTLDDNRAKAQTELIDEPYEENLYESFIPDSDKHLIDKLHSDNINNLADIKFKDKRLNSLLPKYIARNYPKELNKSQRCNWLKYCRVKLTSGGSNSQISQYVSKIADLKKIKKSKRDQLILEELRLYGQSILQSLDT